MDDRIKMLSLISVVRAAAKRLARDLPTNVRGAGTRDELLKKSAWEVSARLNNKGAFTSYRTQMT